MDKLGESAKKGLDFLKNRAQETMDVQRLSSTVKQLTQRREKAILDLGFRVLAAYGEDNMSDEMFRDRVEEVHQLNEEIERAVQEQEETKEQLRQSVGDIMPKSRSSIPTPDYEDMH